MRERLLWQLSGKMNRRRRAEISKHFGALRCGRVRTGAMSARSYLPRAGLDSSASQSAERRQAAQQPSGVWFCHPITRACVLPCVPHPMITTNTTVTRPTNAERKGRQNDERYRKDHDSVRSTQRRRVIGTHPERSGKETKGEIRA